MFGIGLPWPWCRRERSLADHYIESQGRESFDAVVMAAALKNGCIPADLATVEKGDTLIEMAGQKFVMKAWKPEIVNDRRLRLTEMG